MNDKVLPFKPAMVGEQVEALEPRKPGEQGGAAAPKVYKFKTIAEFETEETSKKEIFSGLLAHGETASIIAAPKMCKSALAAEAGVHAAAGLDWHGFKSTGAVGVAYFAMERQMLTKRRIKAHRKLLELPLTLPLVVCNDLIDMTRPGSDRIMIETLLAMGKAVGIPIGLSIYDTRAKLIAGAGGDEDKARDRGIINANMQRVRNETNVCTLFIGHTGKNADRGERGSNSALGDDDVQMTITRTGDVFSLQVNAANDMDEGHLFSFKSVPYVFGDKKDGSPDLVHIIGEEAQKPKMAAADAKLTPDEKTFFSILHIAGREGLTLAEWTKQGKEVGLVPPRKGGGEGRVAKLYDLKIKLMSKGVVREYNGRFYVKHN